MHQASLEEDIRNFPAALVLLQEAASLMQEATQIVESARVKITTEELRSSYASTMHQYFAFYIEALMQLDLIYNNRGYGAQALEIAEHGRARSLLDLLSESEINIRQDVDANLLDNERSLQQQLSYYADRRIRLAGNQAKKQELETVGKKIAELESGARNVEAAIRRTSPRFAALTQPQPVSAAAIQHELSSENTIVLEYALGEERSFLWIIDPVAIHAFELPGREKIEPVARALYGAFAARPDSKPDGKQAQMLAVQLSGMILSPGAALLGNKRLIIIPDGALHFVPFAALSDPASSTRLPLVMAHEISYSPSGSVLVSLKKEVSRQPAPKLLAVIADPVFDRSDPRLAHHAGTFSGASAPRERSLERAIYETAGKDATSSLPRLPFSRLEADSIYSLIRKQDGLEALDFDASLATATNPGLSQYRIVHFATHGLLDSEDPALSGLVFSLFDRQGRSQPGFLSLNSIYNLRLSADLIVLSACQTGLGKYINGEGLIGLTRGFIYAGARRVVASVWKIDDIATAQLMKRFYESLLRDHASPSAALRKAQMSLIQSTSFREPYYWAPFLLQGESN